MKKRNCKLASRYRDLIIFTIRWRWKRIFQFAAITWNKVKLTERQPCAMRLCCVCGVVDFKTFAMRKLWWRENCAWELIFTDELPAISRAPSPNDNFLIQREIKFSNFPRALSFRAFDIEMKNSSLTIPSPGGGRKLFCLTFEASSANLVPEMDKVLEAFGESRQRSSVARQFIINRVNIELFICPAINSAPSWASAPPSPVVLSREKRQHCGGKWKSRPVSTRRESSSHIQVGLARLKVNREIAKPKLCFHSRSAHQSRPSALLRIFHVFSSLISLSATSP